MFRLFSRQERLKIINNRAMITRLIVFGSLIMNIHTCLNGAQDTNDFSIRPLTIDKISQQNWFLSRLQLWLLKLLPTTMSISKCNSFSHWQFRCPFFFISCIAFFFYRLIELLNLAFKTFQLETSHATDATGATDQVVHDNNEATYNSNLFASILSKSMNSEEL